MKVPLKEDQSGEQELGDEPAALNLTPCQCRQAACNDQHHMSEMVSAEK